jgi:flagellar hook protein FlgE
MNIGVTGMDAYQAQIDVISNNIANVGTTAFKDQSVSFQDLLYQTQLPASGPTKTSGGVNYQQVGIGVKVGQTNSDLTQGGVQTTGVNTNMMINGDGYFVLANADGTGTPSYTRNGDFSLNSAGLLFNPATGQGVMGYSANSSGAITAASPGPIQIPLGLKSQATATGAGAPLGPTGDKVYGISVGGTLDSSQFASATTAGAVAPADLATVGTTIYDSLGGAHLVELTFQPQISSAGVGVPMSVNNAAGIAVTAATEYAYTVSSTDGTLFSSGGVSSTSSQVQYAFFDANGQFINTSSTIAATSVSVHQATSVASAAAGDALNVSQWGVTPLSNNSTTTNPPSTLPLGIDLSGITALSQTAGLQATQNGVPPGTLSNISIGQDGTITGAFTNGQSQTLARVAVATFQNEEGLLRLGGSEMSASPSSGAAILGTANSGRFGSITGDALELSNVSIADEFTKLITAQNAFTANSKSITTANADDQTAIGLIR